MKVYFDTEFTGLHQNTSLISIGLVSETGQKIYLEFNDYDRTQCDQWIKDNVLKHCKWLSDDRLNSGISSDNGVISMCSSRESCRKVLEQYLSQFDEVQLVSDVCHYDMMLFISIFGTAFDIPKNVSATCHDINQDIARYFDISEKEAFDMSREQIVQQVLGVELEGDKHNSLYDACVIKTIDEILCTNGMSYRIKNID